MHYREGVRMGKERSTTKQEEILNYIKQIVTLKGYPPSVREIGEAVGLTSTSTVHSHLAKLERRGLIRRDPTKPRAIEITDEDFRQSGYTIIPLLGKVTAGQPILAVEDIEEYIPVPLGMNPSGELFALRVKGDSMIDAGIFDHDVVFVQKQSVASNGEIVVAMTDEGEATVKRFYLEKNKIRLQPENSGMQPLYFDHVTILGKVVGLWRII